MIMHLNDTVVDLAQIWIVGPVVSKGMGHCFRINGQVEIGGSNLKLVNQSRAELIRQWSAFKQTQTRTA